MQSPPLKPSNSTRSVSPRLVLVAVSDGDDWETVRTWAQHEHAELDVLRANPADASFWRLEHAVLRIVEWGPSLHPLALDGPGSATLVVLDKHRHCPSVRPSATWDVICRPFAAREFAWRANRMMSGDAARDTSALVPNRRRVLRIRPESDEVLLDGAALDLRKMERRVLAHLARNHGRWLSTLELQQQVLGACGDGGAVRTQVYEVRRKLAQHGLGQSVCHARGKGYSFAVDGETLDLMLI